MWRRRLITILLFVALVLMVLGFSVPAMEYPRHFIAVWTLTSAVLVCLIALGLWDIILTYYQLSYTVEGMEVRKMKDQIKGQVKKK